LKRLILVLFALILFSGCTKEFVKDEKNLVDHYGYAERVLYELPEDWKDLDAREKTIERYEKYLTGLTFFIDPGHGGEDRRNKSRSGKVVEADVNLYVALSLRDYLKQAGAKVILSREDDSTVDLGYRSELANKSGADFFISIHHNAPGKAEAYWTNYTSTYYHARPENYEYEPADQDLARFVQRDLAYVMDNPGGLGSFDGTYSDYMIYPGDGFSVLRKTEIPAILVECSFFSNRLEEIRLQSKEFNQIQAWGIFRGIGKYFMTGTPKINFLKETSGLKNDTLTLHYLLEDETGIDPFSIKTFVDSVQSNYLYDQGTNKLTIELANPAKGEHMVRVICKNVRGNHSLPYHKKILVK